MERVGGLESLSLGHSEEADSWPASDFTEASLRFLRWLENNIESLVELNVPNVPSQHWASCLPSFIRRSTTLSSLLANPVDDVVLEQQIRDAIIVSNHWKKLYFFSDANSIGHSGTLQAQALASMTNLEQLSMSAGVLDVAVAKALLTTVQRMTSLLRVEYNGRGISATSTGSLSVRSWLDQLHLYLQLNRLPRWLIRVWPWRDTP